MTVERKAASKSKEKSKAADVHETANKIADAIFASAKKPDPKKQARRPVN